MELYKLTSELARIEISLAENGGELTPELEALLDEANLAITAKAASIGKWCLNLGAEVAVINAEITRLKAAETARENLRKRLMDYIKAALISADIQTMDCGIFKLTVAKNPPSVEIVNEEAIPSEYVIVTTARTVDKRDVLDALKAGEVVPGARLVTDKTNLRIK